MDNILNDICSIYSDFYITKDNLRLPIRENAGMLYNLLNKGDKIIFDDEGNGIAIIVGYAEKRKRKYLKMLVKNEKIADRIVKNIGWNISSDLYCKIKRINPIKKILLKNNFKFFAGRGQEILLKKTGKIYNNEEL